MEMLSGEIAVGKDVREEIIALLEGYVGEVRFNEPMAPYTTMKIGGAAEAIFFPASIEEVASLMKRLSKTDIPFFVLGGGSNLLVLDGGILGIVIHLKNLDQVVLTGTETLYAEAGISFPKLSVLAQKQGLTGIEFATGIPGTVGGAVAMNAGIPGSTTESVIKNVTVVTCQGEVVALSKEECAFSYRATGLPEGVIVSAELMLQSAELQTIEKKRIEQVKRRRETQPLNYPNAGSIFKNPGSLLMPSAGKLIEQVHLKG